MSRDILVTLYKYLTICFVNLLATFDSDYKQILIEKKKMIRQLRSHDYS